MSRPLLTSFLTIALSFPAHGELRLGPAIEPVEPATIHARAGADVAAGSNGRDFLAAWTTTNALMVQRVDDRGVPLTERGTAIAITPARLGGIASAGGDYAVAWSAPDGVWVGIVPGDGSNPHTRRIAPRDTTTEGPRIASNGASYLVVWKDGPIQGMLLTPQGDPIGPPFVIRESSTLPRIASDGQNFLATGPKLVFPSDRDPYQVDRIFVQTISSAGEVGPLVDLAPANVNVYSEATALVFDGDSYLLLQSEGTVDGSRELLTALDREGKPGRVSVIPGSDRPSMIVTSGHGSLLLFDASLRILSIAKGGEIEDREPRSLPSFGVWPTGLLLTGASNGEAWFIFGNRDTLQHTVFPTWSTQPPPTRPTAFASALNDSAHIEAVGDVDFVFTREGRPSVLIFDVPLKVTRVRNGVALDSATVIADEPAGWETATDGSRVMVMWSEGYGGPVRGRTIDLRGAISAPFDVAVPRTTGRSHLAALEWTGDSFLAIWREEFEVFPIYPRRVHNAAHFVRLTGDGAVLEQGTFDLGTESIGAISIATTSTGFLLVYERRFLSGLTYELHDIMVASFDANAVPLSAPAFIANTHVHEHGPVVASDGDGRVLVAWAESTFEPERPGTAIALIVDGLGQVMSPRVTLAAGPFVGPADAVWTGQSFLVVSGGDTSSSGNLAQISRDGVVLSTQQLSDIPGSTASGWSLASANSRITLAYLRWTADAERGADRRIVMRQVSEPVSRRRAASR
jgi:hypothetical protein